MAFYKQRIRFFLFLSIALVALAVVFFALTAFFITDDNIIIIKIIDCVFLSFSVSFLFYSIINIIKPYKRKINHIYTVLNSSSKHLVCQIKEITEIKTISKDVVAQQLFVQSGDLELFINYNLDCPKKEFLVGSTIAVDVANSFIINEEN